jgi:hypothetical protein
LISNLIIIFKTHNLNLNKIRNHFWGYFKQTC